MKKNFNQQQYPQNDPAYKILKSESIYDGHIIKVFKDQVKMPEGNSTPREVVETSNAVAVVALDDRQNVFLVKQYRHPLKKFIWEIPAGRMDKQGESELETARRELKEEAGLESDNWSQLGIFLSSPGFTTEKIDIFLAKNVHHKKENNFKATQEELDIEIKKLPLNSAINDILNGSITDGKTIAGLTLAEKSFKKKE